jgi:hypothetical protein
MNARLHPTQVSSADRTIGAAFVVAAIVFQATLLGRPATLLSVALVIAYILWIGGAWSSRDPQLGITYAIGVAIFLAHASEEYITGFHRRLPSVAGSPPWSDAQFLIFNIVWFTIFVTAWATHRRHALSALVILFFAIGVGVGNGLAHVVLTIVQGAYFPGTWTAPLCAVVGGLLLWRLFRLDPVADEA